MTTLVDTERGLDDPVWVLEELVDVRPTAPLTRTTRRSLVAVGMAAAIVGFGFIGHLSTPPVDVRTPEAVPAAPTAPVVEGPADGPADSHLTIDELAAGRGPDAGSLAIHGRASRPLGTIHVAVVLGSAILGWANIRVDHAGPFVSRIEYFQPAFTVTAEVRISGGTDRIDIRRPVDLPATRIGVWSSPSRIDGTGRRITVRGFAQGVGSEVTVEVRDTTGRVVAEVIVPVEVDEAIPGSFGGSLVGLGSFRAILDLAADACGRAGEIGWRSRGECAVSARAS